MTKKNITLVQGVNENNEVNTYGFNRDGSMIYNLKGNIDIGDALNSSHLNISHLMLDTRQNQEIMIRNTDVFFNLIHNSDNNKTALTKLENIYKVISEKKKIPLFNSPENIRKTTRDNIYQLLHSIKKLIVPKTVRLQPKSASDIYEVIRKEKFEFPVIFRPSGDHGGFSTLLIENENEQFYPFCLDGKDYYLTQFVDYKEDGLYSKYRLVVIDGEVYLRHVIVGKEWMVHAKSHIPETEKYQVSIAKRFNREIKPSIQPTITEIYNIIGLDFFGIDCHIDKEMNLLVFEINASMNIFYSRENSVFKKHLDVIKESLIQMLIDSEK